MDGRTRAVALSWVDWFTGHRLDLDRLGAACRTTSALTIVDAMQGVGAVPLDVTTAQVDCCLAGSYKWLMGVPGTAVMYTSPRFLAETTPDRAGYAGMTTSVHAPPVINWLPGAARFHVGGPINPALVALEQSVDLLLETGVPRVQAHLSALLDALQSGLESAGLRLNSDLSPAHCSGFLNGTTGMLGVRRGTIAITIDCPMDGHGRDACVSLEVEDADRYYEEWRTRVPGLKPPRNEPWGARTFGFSDPSGNTTFVMGPLR